MSKHKDTILEMREEGLSFKHIADFLGFSVSTIWTWARFWGDKTNINNSNPAKRMFERTLLSDDPDGCFECTYSTSRGYPKVPKGGGYVIAHRLAWEYYYGPIPAGLHVLHKCDNKICVRPDHLFIGTHADNMRDAVIKGRILKGEDCSKAKLKKHEVVEIIDLCKYGMKHKEISVLYGIDNSNISRIWTRKAWKNVQ